MQGDPSPTRPDVAAQCAAALPTREGGSLTWGKICMKDFEDESMDDIHVSELSFSRWDEVVGEQWVLRSRCNDTKEGAVHKLLQSLPRRTTRIYHQVDNGPCTAMGVRFATRCVHGSHRVFLRLSHRTGPTPRKCWWVRIRFKIYPSNAVPAVRFPRAAPVSHVSHDLHKSRKAYIYICSKCRKPKRLRCICTKSEIKRSCKANMAGVS